MVPVTTMTVAIGMVVIRMFVVLRSARLNVNVFRVLLMVYVVLRHHRSSRLCHSNDTPRGYIPMSFARQWRYRIRLLRGAFPHG